MPSAFEDAEEETVTLEEHASSSGAIDSHVPISGQPGQITIRLQRKRKTADKEGDRSVD